MHGDGKMSIGKAVRHQDSEREIKMTTITEEAANGSDAERLCLTHGRRTGGVRQTGRQDCQKKGSLMGILQTEARQSEGTKVKDECVENPTENVDFFFL